MPKKDERLIDQIIYKESPMVDFYTFFLEKAIKNLPLRERGVIEIRFGKDLICLKTYEQVGKEIGVTRERVRQIEAKAFEIIKNFLSEELKEFLHKKFKPRIKFFCKLCGGELKYKSLKNKEKKRTIEATCKKCGNKIINFKFNQETCESNNFQNTPA